MVGGLGRIGLWYDCKALFVHSQCLENLLAFLDMIAEG